MRYISAFPAASTSDRVTSAINSQTTDTVAEPDQPVSHHIPRRKSIIFAGCLGMIYTQLTLSPASIEFTRQLGGDGLHIGILGAIPTGMLFLQFLSAIAANHLNYRRGLWIAVSLVQRLVLLPVALGPVLLPGVDLRIWLILFLLASALNHGMLHFATPLWMSWMADYLPQSLLCRFWGERHLWMQWSGAAALLGAALLLPPAGSDIIPAFAMLTVVATVPGVIDVLIFLRVAEPPVTRLADTSIARVLAEPFRHAEFRSFISFMCFWHFAAMIGSPFISLYLLSTIGMSLPQLMFLWVFCWVGGAIFAGRIGRFTESHGHRPVLVLCTILKSTNMIALILIPENPFVAFVVLIPVFIVDSVLNAGFVIASNGFMLTKSPSGNRTMFIAAGTALAGLVGGITSIICGAVLHWLDGGTSVFGSQWNSFQILFAVSVLMRLASVLLVIRIREPQARRTRYVVGRLVGATPMRMLRFPIGLFRQVSDDEVFLPVKDQSADADARHPIQDA